MCNNVSVTINENETMTTDNVALSTNDILEKQPRLCLTVEGNAVIDDTLDKVVSWLRDMRDDARERHNRNISHLCDVYKKEFDNISCVEREMYEHAMKMESVAADGECRVYRQVAHKCFRLKKAVLPDLEKLGRELTATEKLSVEDRALFMVLIALDIKIASRYFDFWDSLELSEGERNGYPDKVGSLIVNDKSFDCFNRKLLNFHEAGNARVIKELTVQYACDAIEAVHNKIIERMDEIERLRSSNESNENA